MSNVTSALELKGLLDSKLLMDTLADGHGYDWRILIDNPRIACGVSSRGDLPELVIINQTILVWNGDEVYHSRLERIIKLLSRQFVRRGVALG